MIYFHLKKHFPVMLKAKGKVSYIVSNYQCHPVYSKSSPSSQPLF